MSEQLTKYESGFQWKCEKSGEPERPGINPWAWNLYAPSGKVAATVFCHETFGGHNWFSWDENGTGGENSCEPTIEKSMISAESAVLRWGKHFACRSPRKRKKEVSVANGS